MMIANICDYSSYRLVIVYNFTGIFSLSQSSPIHILTLHLQKLKVAVVNLSKISYLTGGVGS